MKKEYQEPEVKKVELVPEEALLTSCKTAGYTGVGYKYGACDASFGISCKEVGS